MDKSQLPDWATAEEISNRPDVHEALQGFSEDPTGDNGVCVVRAILAAAAPGAGERNAVLDEALEVCQMVMQNEAIARVDEVDHCITGIKKLKR